MAGTTSRQTEEEPNQDASLFSNLRHHGDRNRCHHCVAGKALVVPERGEAHISLTLLALTGSNMKA